MYVEDTLKTNDIYVANAMSADRKDTWLTVQSNMLPSFKVDGGEEGEVVNLNTPQLLHTLCV